MKVKDGKTLEFTKKGTIAYESKGNDSHLVSLKCNTHNLHRIKFEERFRGQTQLPVKRFFELEYLENLKPFSYQNGKSKYLVYDFEKAKQETKSKKLLNFLEQVEIKGFQHAYSEYNRNRNANRMLKQYLVEFDLDFYWRCSFLKFFGNPFNE